MKIGIPKNKIKFMVDRLCENMLILNTKNKNRVVNRIFCNLNKQKKKKL